MELAWWGGAGVVGWSWRGGVELAWWGVAVVAQARAFCGGCAEPHGCARPPLHPVH